MTTSFSGREANKVYLELGAVMRCICITSVVFNGNATTILAPHHTRDQLPNAVLYWDKVTVPILAPGMAPELDAEIDMLEAEDCAVKWYYKNENSFSSEDAHAFAGHFVDGIAARLRDSDQWSVIIPGDGDVDVATYQSNLEARLGPDRQAGRTITLALLDALPVCPPDTPFQDIIDFKRQRADQLANLHNEIAYVSASLSGSDDLEASLHAGKERVSSALSDLDRVFSEKWSARVLTALRANTGSIAAGALGGAVAAGHGGFSIPLTALAGGAVVPVIEAAVNGLMTPRSLPDRATPYLYAIDAQKTLRR